MSKTLRNARAGGRDEFADARQRQNRGGEMNAELRRLSVLRGNNMRVFDSLAPAQFRHQPVDTAIGGVGHFRQQDRDVQAKFLSHSFCPFRWIEGARLAVASETAQVRLPHDHDQGAHSHDHGSHDQGGHDHASETKRIDIGHGVLLLEVFEDSVPPRFRIRIEGAEAALPRAAALSLETLRPDGSRQTFSFAQRAGYLESLEEIPEPHEFTVSLSLSHGDHAHRHEARFEEHQHAPSVQPSAIALAGGPRSAGMVKSDRAVILGLFTLLTFSPCEGFLPVYLSGITYGWMGFVVLSAVLAVATIAGMVIFTWLTMSGMERLRLGFLERYESGILGGLILFLGIGIIFFGF